MRAFIVPALITIGLATARADCLQWGVDANGNKTCMRDDLVNRRIVTPIIGDTTVTVTAGTGARCRGDYTVVMLASGRVACARDIIDPER